MKVKMILPALTEATSPFWRPIKYSLFPPLGLATLAGYLSPTTTTSRFRTSTWRRSTWTTRPTWSSSRSTSRRRTARIASPITTADGVRMSRSAASMSRRCRTRPRRMRTRSSSGPARIRGRSFSPTSGAAGRVASIGQRSERSTAFRRFDAI